MILINYSIIPKRVWYYELLLNSLIFDIRIMSTINLYCFCIYTAGFQESIIKIIASLHMYIFHCSLCNNIYTSFNRYTVLRCPNFRCKNYRKHQQAYSFLLTGFSSLQLIPHAFMHSIFISRSFTATELLYYMHQFTLCTVSAALKKDLGN